MMKPKRPRSETSIDTLVEFRDFNEYGFLKELMRTAKSIICKVESPKLPDLDTDSPTLGFGLEEFKKSELNTCGKKYVAKVFPGFVVLDSKNQKRLIESTILNKSLNHPNICQVHDFFVYEGDFYIIIDYLPKSTALIDIPEQNFCLFKGEKFLIKTFKFLIDILVDVINALIYMHDKGVVHCDIKPDNIIFNELEGIVKALLIDFDLSCHTKTMTETIKCGTLYYHAPELIKGPVTNPFACDIYSLGVTMYFIFNRGKYPFPTVPEEDCCTDETGITAEFMTSYKKLRLESFEAPSQSGIMKLDALIMSMLNRDPSLRPTISVVHNKLKQIIDDTVDMYKPKLSESITITI